jgi:SAM-dependent methyltransferase
MTTTAETQTDWPCFLCQGDSRRLFSVHGYWVRECEACGHQFAEVERGVAHIERTYQDDYFTGGGAGYSDYLAEREILVERGRRYGQLLCRFAPPGEVLDVGAAAGFTLAGLHAAGWRGQGIEPNAAMARYAREAMQQTVEQGSVETWTPDRAWHAIVLLQVLPHLTNPAAAMEKFAAWLKPGGLVLIETWNRRSWTARLLGRNWHEYSPPSVLHWFSLAEIDRLAGAGGLSRVATGRPAKWIAVGHARSLLAHKLGSSIAARLLLAPSFLLPGWLALPYPAEDLLWVIYRKPDRPGAPAAGRQRD